MGYVYLLLEVDKDGGERHKIGISKNHPSKRQSQLQTGNSNLISVLSFYESVNYKKVEQWLHNKYSNYKTEANNEWFILSNEDVAAFQFTCKKADETISFLIDNNHFFK
jgi:hypothetical protein